MSWNNQQFMSQEQVIRDVGPIGMSYLDRYTIRPEDILGRFIIQPLAGHRLQAKTVQVQQLTNLLDRAPVINQMYGPQAIKMPQLMAYIMEVGFDIRNAEEFITIGSGMNLMTALREHACWYQGEIPPVREDDNHMRHTLVHLEELKEERFDLLEQQSPGTAARARQHIEEHMHMLAAMKEYQEKQMADMAQFAATQNMGQGGGSPTPGAAGPGQDPDSPQIRRNENERGEGAGQAENAEANSGAPNPGQA